jgi:hypothetical protein
VGVVELGSHTNPSAHDGPPWSQAFGMQTLLTHSPAHVSGSHAGTQMATPQGIGWQNIPEGHGV